MTPRAEFRELRALWLQVTGTRCNLACRHCFNASGPRDPWLGSLEADVVRRAIAEGEVLGVRELYFTGGEPFLHPEIFALLADALAVAPTTVLTVRYALLTAEPDLDVEFVTVPYDHETLAREMEREGLPAEFAETIRTGWWTCCLESLPVKERARGRY